MVVFFTMALAQETVVQCYILLFLGLEYLWQLYLSIRQYNVVKNTVYDPSELNNIMTRETYEKARIYALDRELFRLVRSSYMILVSTIFVYSGILAILWKYSTSISPFDGEVSNTHIWLFFLITILTMVNLPPLVYFTFVVEEKHGFNKQTAKFFVVDQIKMYIFMQVLFLPFPSVTIFIVKYGGKWFFLWLWLVFGVMLLLFEEIFPAYIAPLFDKYTPLPEGELKTGIENLAQQLNFPLGQLYVVEGSLRSSHGNAFFGGLFGAKTILFYDTLLATCKTDEVLGVLSHELGHWKCGHIFKFLICDEINLFLLFFALSLLYVYSSLYQAFGFPPNVQPVFVGLYIVYKYALIPYNAISSFLTNCLRRRFEVQADAFAADLGKAEPLKRGLIRMYKDNIFFPIYDPLYSAWHLSHPPLLERLAALQKSN